MFVIRSASITASSASRSVMSPRTCATRASSGSSMISAIRRGSSPRSYAITSIPRSTRSLVTQEPMQPYAPVTSTRVIRGSDRDRP